MKELNIALAMLLIGGAAMGAQTTQAANPSSPSTYGSVLGSDAGMPLPRQAQGTIVGLDRERKALTLDDGTRLIIPTNAHLVPIELKEGERVKASYETQDGQKVVTSIEVRGTSEKISPGAWRRR